MSLGRASGMRNGTLRALAAKKVTVPAALAKKSSKSRSFYFRYLELCRAQNLTPVPEIRKKPDDKSTLEFYADKLSVSDWLLVNESLHNDLCLKNLVLRMRRSYQHNTIDPIDTENRARLFKQRPVVFTRFIFRGLVQSIANCVASNKNLTVLQLEGLPLYGGYIDCIAKSLAANDCLETLSFRKSIIGDKGCELVCNSAKYLNRIALFDLSECRITAKGAVHVADMIKMQKISRYTDGWEPALRYHTPDLQSHLGLRTLLLANNPDIGDQGLKLICEVLKEDAWIKVIDMQGCGLTDIGGDIILDCLDLNLYIREFNLRNNEAISQPMHRSIREHLGTTDADEKQEPAYDVSFFHGLQSLPKGKKFTITELRSNNEMLEQRLSFERTLRKRAEKLNLKLSDQLMGIDSSGGSEKEEQEQMEGEHDSQSEAPLPHMLDEYLEKHPIESQKYCQTLFTGLFNSSATTPAVTPRHMVKPMEFSYFEEPQNAPRQQSQVQMMRNEMKYAERNVQEANKNNEWKADYEFANERHFKSKVVQFEQFISDTLVGKGALQHGRAANEGAGDGQHKSLAHCEQYMGETVLTKGGLKQMRGANEGAGDGKRNLIERFEQYIGETVETGMTKGCRKQECGPNDGAGDGKHCKQAQQRGTTGPAGCRGRID